MGFHGYVASPVGCAGSDLRPVLLADRLGVVDLLIHHKKDSVLSKKKNGPETRSPDTINIHPFFDLSSQKQTKMVVFQKKDAVSLFFRTMRRSSAMPPVDGLADGEDAPFEAVPAFRRVLVKARLVPVETVWFMADCFQPLHGIADGGGVRLNKQFDSI